MLRILSSMLNFILNGIKYILKADHSVITVKGNTLNCSMVCLDCKYFKHTLSKGNPSLKMKSRNHITA